MKIKLFWKIYAVIVAIAIALMLIFFAVFWYFLSSYEKSQPKHEMEHVLQLFEKDDVQDLMKHIKYQISEYESDDIIKNDLDQKIKDGNWSFEQSGETFTKNVPVFQVKRDGEKIATITLKKSDQRGSFNTAKWDIDSIDGLLNAKTYTILAPENAIVFLDGKQLTEAQQKEKNIPVEELTNVKTVANLPGMVKYSIDGLYVKPDVSAKGGVYQASLAVTNPDEQTYQVAFENKDEFDQSVETEITEFSKLYGSFVSNDVKFAQLSPYIVKNSHAYGFLEKISTTNIWVEEHSAPEFTDMKISNYQIYNDRCFSCEVSFKMSFISAGKTFEYPTSLKIFWVRTEGKWYVEDLALQ